MKTVLEIFYVRIMGKNVRYQRRRANLSQKGGDPDAMIRSLIQEKRRADSGEVEEKEFVVHSTSWRYERPDKVTLTYIAYSDELEFPRGKTRNIPLKKLGTITKNSRKPRSQTEVENKVVSHAMRHIAFLIQTGDQENFRDALSPKTIKVFEKLWVSLAGEVL
jgi:hypothetical protein